VTGAGQDASAEQARAEGYQEDCNQGFQAGLNSVKPRLTGEEAHAQNMAAGAADAPPPRKRHPPATSAPVSKKRRLEIIAHKAQQIENERQVLERMMGRATDDATINNYLDSVRDLKEREALIREEQRTVEMLDDDH
jgi:hypothetical protein